MIRIGVIGGDKREEVLIDNLAQQGFTFKVLKKNALDTKAVKYFNDLKEVISDVDAVLAPMSSTDHEGYLKSTFDNRSIKLDRNFFSLLGPQKPFIIGIARPSIKKELEFAGVNYIELARQADLAILNAIPTAEGAIKIAIEETDYTLYNSRTLVFGLGKVGLTLAWRLRMLGAESYAVTRDRKAAARGKDLGIKMFAYEELNGIISDTNILFNTVPVRIISKEIISLLKKDSVIIDLASAPGGTDFTEAEKAGIKAILALGLPGKIAPVTAGKILADILPGLLSDL
ncbi:dipicolinate synthase subunit DpsA [Iocasia frigidifontis]|uniref:Dipicolinate synthase subunit DpsA n=1 Tax=Iocasia fonsfrigidae TaxID=2682810 RepID=A0A8A7KAU9_9FIRM|nr:dipicolinate synthase subunit DpsA [Iocasia fonsfrigidae]QTL98370.1 dipicolinate synthase subunit DpsA [Iocasia fonsfrigidae]